MTEFDVRVVPATWAGERATIERIRRRVFIEEQAVPEELEWDGEDEHALHWLAWLGDAAVGTVRLRAGDHIGRMAVLREQRGRGVGRRLLDTAVAHARASGATEVHLHAQVHALAFYDRAGFIAEGPVFDDAGIPHRTMRRLL